MVEQELPLGPTSPKQQKALETFEKVQVLVLGGAVFGGKVQPYTSVVYTTHGPKKLGDIGVGDLILNPNGSSQKVIAVHPHKDHQFYKVSFDDGTSTYCGLEHLWVAWRCQKKTKKQATLNKKYGKNDQRELYDHNAEVISLEGILDWIDRGYNVKIPVSKELPFNSNFKQLIDPYLLGLLLGDGCLTNKKTLGYTRHKEDSEIDSFFISEGFDFTPCSKNLNLKFKGEGKLKLVEILDKLGLIGTYSHNKFIPKHYLNTPLETRKELLRGLMDSDGYVDERGHLEFSTTSIQLSKDFMYLVRSLGGKVSVKEKQGRYKDLDGNSIVCKKYYRHYLRFNGDFNPFKLKRKLDRYKPETRLSKTVTSIEKAFIADGCCITVSDPNRLYVTDDFIVTHNSFLGTMMSIPYTDDPRSRIAVFRTSLEDMKKGGAIIDTFRSVYSNIEDHVKLDVGGNPPVGKIVSGPGAGEKRGAGCRIEFIPMARDADTESIRGAQFSLALIEEATPNFTQYQIEFIMSRLRSDSRHESKMIITTNPYPDHFICELIKDYYLDEEGYAIEDRSGDVRYFYKYNGEYVWGDTKEEVAEVVGFDISDEDQMNKILSFSFVQLTMWDNPIGMKKNPGYVAFLEGLDPIAKARNLKGNWFIRAEGSGVFKREWIRGDKGERVKTLADLPENCIAMRGVDKAYSVPTDENPSPDYTSISPLFLKDNQGFYWILGNYHPRIIDEKPFNKQDKPYLGKFRKLAGERDNLIALQMKSDIVNQEAYKYQTPKLVLAKESAGAGTDFYSTVARMAEEGIKVEKDQTIGNVKGKKMQDFLPFCKACELGMVFIIEETFEKDSLEGWYKELEAFDGERSGRYKKDDQVDSTSITFNAIDKAKRPYRTPLIGSPRTQTISADYLRQTRT